MRAASQHVLEVADEPIDISSTGRLMNDVLVVIIAESAAQLFIVHLWFLLAGAPAARDLVRVAKAELPGVARPRDDVLTVGVGQLLQ